MVLEGSFGCFTNEDFTINIVNDDDPSNGNILDGCGQFIYEITGTQVDGSTGGGATPPMTISGFTGDFVRATLSTENVDDPSALTVALNGSTSIEFEQSADPTASGNFDDAFGFATITIPEDGTASFDWLYSSNEFGNGIPGAGFDFEFLRYSLRPALKLFLLLIQVEIL